MSSVAYRTSVSLSPRIGKRLQSYKNKSSIIEKALNIFFERENFLINAEKKFFISREKKLKKIKKSEIDSLVGVISFVPENIRDDYTDTLIKKYL